MGQDIDRPCHRDSLVPLEFSQGVGCVSIVAEKWRSIAFDGLFLSHQNGRQSALEIDLHPA
jgi:hypothetical protein